MAFSIKENSPFPTYQQIGISINNRNQITDTKFALYKDTSITKTTIFDTAQEYEIAVGNIPPKPSKEDCPSGPNAIDATFDFTGANNGDTLFYNSFTNKFEAGSLITKGGSTLPDGSPDNTPAGGGADLDGGFF